VALTSSLIRSAAEAAFRPEWPGESGVRNNVIGDGMFNIDTGVTKDFSVGERTRVEFSWQAFNATNSVRYDVRGAQPFALLRPVTIRQICWNYHHASIHAVRIAIRVLMEQSGGLSRTAATR
jgi:hypothetical protein